MAATHFSGPLAVAAGSLTLGEGPIEIGTGAAATRPVEVITLSLPVTAVANTDLTLTLPACRILRVTQRTTTAYTGNTVTIQVGTAAAGQEVVAAVSIKTKANRALTLVDASADALAAFAGGTIYVRIVQTATETAVGAGELMIEFVRTATA